MDLSIIIVNWNTKDLLRECIDSVYKETKTMKYEIIICDNDSIDGSADIDVNKYKNVKVIYSKDNLGFSKGNNLAIDRATGKYLLLLNPDTIVLDGAIDKAYNYIKDKENILLGVKLLNQDRSIQTSSIKFPNIKNLLLRNQPYDIATHNITHETDCVMGAFMMLEKELYESVGRLDDRYFMYCEELDLCYQIKKNGGKVVYLAEAVIVHLYNQSGSKKWNSKRDKVVHKSFLMFINKNYHGIKKILCLIIIKLRYIVRMILKNRS